MTTETSTDLDQLCINTIRTLSMDAVQKANSGHPGAPMALAPAAFLLFTRIMNHHPQNPDWPNRDRFILSNGHASVLLYSVLHLTGYDVSLDDLKTFRQLGSKTPGHPEFGHTPGVETTTGPLGQGFANAVGMAIAERHLAARFNRPKHAIIDHYTYVMCGDGDLMEGVSAEAASLAGHLGLGKLICIYDDNHISIEGRTDIAFTEDVSQRFDSYHWHVLTVEDGNDLAALQKAIETAKTITDKPTLIKLTTHIAYGSPNKQDSSDAHGAPLGEEECLLAKKNLQWPSDQPFFVPADVLNFCRKAISQGKTAEQKWRSAFEAYQTAFADESQALSKLMAGDLPSGWEQSLPVFQADAPPVATRAASGTVLNALAENIAALLGGSADLAPSNKTYLNGFAELQKNNYAGRNIRFGVREHGMAACLAGIQLHTKGLRPYGGTFLVFSDYMRPSIRVAALMGIPVIYVFTHDSVAVGEDGPTHQPVEHLCALRAIPNLTVIRPADANETAAAWRLALKNTAGPTALILSRQKLPILNPSLTQEHIDKGAYVLADSADTPDIILIATGSEVHLALTAKTALKEQKIDARVVSMPSWELFEKASPDYRESVLPAAIKKRLAIEAGLPMGWERYIGDAGEVIGINRFGTSAPGQTILNEYGFHADNVLTHALKVIG